ncbi:GlxA family transcriptional regulator [Kordiimonas laminariae]|uniref:GlxA family transcriptional regulator n=1 Tax=Kordiimonas laminariae TaxID=2917717 RepID=UPI001FF21320|nr:GlxA family transcriptional regulator [Kordiimonas laminariae]
MTISSDVDIIPIGLLNYPGSQLSSLYGLTDLFGAANNIVLEQMPDTKRKFQVCHWLVNLETGELKCGYISEGQAPSQLSVLIVPPRLSEDAANTPMDTQNDWIRAQHKGGALISSICAGAFVLAEAGLLKGRRATTHWILREEFLKAHPDVDLQIEKLLVEDGEIITAGGVMAWVDLGLRLIEQFMGAAVMLEVAKFFLVDPSGREQRYYSGFMPRFDHGDSAVLEVQHWLQAHYKETFSVKALADMAGLGERTFLRRFHKATTHKPTAYIQLLRVNKARGFLEQSVMPFNQIAWKVGYEDPSAFRKLFQKIVGLTPGEYKKRFAVG